MTASVRLSKRLSFHLRHRPDLIGVELDRNGWVDVDRLLVALSEHGAPVTRDELDAVVAISDKQRFAYDVSRQRIRASQGHSVTVDLDLPPASPPDRLWHGTHAAVLPAILRDGLHPMGRHAVHLSPDRATAEQVGARRGTPVVLAVDAAAMAADGHEFRVSTNGVWLVEHVPPDRLRVPDALAVADEEIARWRPALDALAAHDATGHQS